jgi:hypothetical protein
LAPEDDGAIIVLGIGDRGVSWLHGAMSTNGMARDWRPPRSTSATTQLGPFARSAPA